MKRKSPLSRVWQLRVDSRYSACLLLKNCAFSGGFLQLIAGLAIGAAYGASTYIINVSSG